MKNLKQVSKEMREYIKTRAISLRREGLKNREIAKLLDIPAFTVANIIYYHKRKGSAFLEEKVRGRKLGEKRTLSPEQEEEIQNALRTSKPENERIASSLWSKPAIQELIMRHFGIVMPFSTIGDYLRRWGFSCQRRARKNYKQDEKKVKEFKEKTYPAIVQKANDEAAEILFVDETGINNQEYRVRGYSPIGCAPTVASVSKTERINMISAISQDGTCRYMCYETSMTQTRFIAFMRLITRAKANRKVLVLTDNLKVHHGKNVKEWLSWHKDKIEIFFIPAYSPELNADEYLNHVLKQNIHSGILPRTKDDIKKTHNFMQNMKKHPEKVKGLFKHKNLEYLMTKRAFKE